jgi:hypothetical protein
MLLPSIPLQEMVRFRRSQAGFEFPGINQAGDLLQGVQRRRDGVIDHGSLCPRTKCPASCQRGWQKSSVTTGLRAARFFGSSSGRA